MTGLSQKDWIANLENAYRDACEAAGKKAADFVLMRYDAMSIYSLNSCYWYLCKMKKRPLQSSFL